MLGISKVLIQEEVNSLIYTFTGLNFVMLPSLATHYKQYKWT